MSYPTHYRFEKFEIRNVARSWWTNWDSKWYLNTSFDWNGIREAIILATENDAGNGVAMLFNHLLSGTVPRYIPQPVRSGAKPAVLNLSFPSP